MVPRSLSRTLAEASRTWQTPALTGAHVQLIPLANEHHDALCEAAEDGALWQLWYTSVPGPAQMRAEIERRLALESGGAMLPFTVIDRLTGRIVGMTTCMHIDRSVPRLEIGSTWYALRVQRTALNTEAKLLLLQHAFDSLDCAVVEFRTHVLNLQSRRAIERLGARFDGILRSHVRMANGTLRDTVVYSIVAAEWPAVQAHLHHNLLRPSAPRIA